MPRDPRPYVTYPVGYTDHPRLALLSDSAFRVFHLMNDYSREYGLDGKFTFEIAKRWPKRALNELIRGIDDRPLVTITETGYYLRSYEEHQYTTADIERLREKRAAAGAAGGRAKASARQTAGTPLASASRNGKQNVAESKSKLEIEDKTDHGHLSLVRPAGDARDLDDRLESLAEDARTLGIKSIDRVVNAVAGVVGEVEPAIALDVARAVILLANDPVRWPEAYLEKTRRDTPDTIREEHARIMASAPQAVV